MLFASIFEKKFLFLHHIGTATGDFMTKSRNFFIFLLPHHICPANSCLLSSKRKKFIFPLSLHIGTAECRLLSWIVKKSRFPLSISYQYSKCPFASKIENFLKFLLSLHICPLNVQIMTFRGKFFEKYFPIKKYRHFLKNSGISLLSHRIYRLSFA